MNQTRAKELHSGDGWQRCYVLLLALASAACGLSISHDILAFAPGLVPLFWGAPGFFLAPLLLLGWRSLPLLALAAVIGETLLLGNWRNGVAAASGDVAGAALALVVLARWLPIDPRLRQQRDLVNLVLAGVAGAPLVLIGGSLLLLAAAGEIRPAHVPYALFLGLAANAVTFLAVVPFMLVWSTQGQVRRPKPSELRLLAGVFLFFAWLRFWPPLVLIGDFVFAALLMLPLAFYVMTRHGRRSASLAALAFALVMATGSRNGVILFLGITRQHEHLALVLFMIAVEAGLVMVAVARSEQDRQQDRIADNESRLRILIDNTKVAPYAMPGPDFITYSFISERIKAISGYTAEEWHQPRAWFRFMHP